MSNPEVAPNATELLDSLKPYRLNTWYLSSPASSSNPWEFSVGELYGCVCHRAFGELARSPIESNAITGLQLRAGAEESRLGSAVSVRDIIGWRHSHLRPCRSIAARDGLLNGQLHSTAV